MWIRNVACTLQTVCPRSGKLTHERVFRSTSVAYCIDERDQRVLVVGEGKQAIEYAVTGGVQLLTPLLSQGKCTLIIVKRNLRILVSDADAAELRAWCGSLASGRPPPPKASVPAPSPLPKRTLSRASPSSANRLTPRVEKKKARDLDIASPDWSDAGGPSLSPGAADALTDEQAEVLRAALSGTSLFFTGGAGTGKSFLLREIIKRLPAATTFATASTGVAACHIGGVTLHYFAGIGGGERPVAELAATAMKRRGAQWRAAKTLVIDEISMVDGALLDTLDEVARRVRGNSKPFGGLQLILCGDFYQLPPVTKGGAAPRFAFEARCWPSVVRRCFELHKVFRQSDPEFIDALAQVRVGRCSAAAEAMLRACRGRPLPDFDGISATRLFTHKDDCNRLNEQRLRALPGAAVTFRARDSGRDEAALSALRVSTPAPPELQLKVGAQVILTKTLDQEKGLVNGAAGVVVKLLASKNPVVRFRAGCELIVRVEPFTLSSGGAVVATRQQLPLDYGWAISVHKSQGMSLARVQMSLGRAFESGQVYVALSRARSLDGLSLIDVDFSKIRANPKVVRFHERMRDE